MINRQNKIISAKRLLCYGISLLTIVLLISWIGVKSIRKQVERDLQFQLTTVLKITREAIHLWIKDRQKEFSFFVRNKSVIHWCTEILQQQDIKKREGHLLAINNNLKELFYDYALSSQVTSFFLLSKQGTVLASLDETILGTQSELAHHERFMNTIFEGQSEMFFHYEYETDNLTHTVTQRFYLGYPITTREGSTVAMVFQINPQKTFQQITDLARPGQSGDTYVFSRDGRTITNSRFIDQLQETGFIDHDASNIGFVLHDPGGNLLEGYTPLGEYNKLPLTYMAQSATRGLSDCNIDGYRDYRGKIVVGAWDWDEEYDIGIVFEIDRDEAFKSYDDIQKTTVSILLLGLLFFFGFVTILIRQNRLVVLLANKTNKVNNFLLDAEAKAKTYRNKLREIMSEQNLVEERERRRIAQELHDEVAQILSVLIIKQQKLQASLQNEEDSQYAQEIIDLLNQVLNDIRHLTFDLSLLVSFRNDLNAAIEGLGNKVFSQVGIDFCLITEGEQVTTSEELRSILCRIVRELLYNIIKHADARHVELKIIWKADKVIMKVIDDGNGMYNYDDAMRNQIRDGFGLLFVRERLEFLHGTVSVASQPGLGTKVHIELPL